MRFFDYQLICFTRKKLILAQARPVHAGSPSVPRARGQLTRAASPRPNETARMNNSDALSLWHRVTLDSVMGDDPDLTSRQFALLTTVYLEAGPHTVRSLALRLSVTKAVISRALDTLASYQFIERRPDPRDKRSVVVVRTAKGSTYLTRFAESIRREMKLGRLSAVAA